MMKLRIDNWLQLDQAAIRNAALDVLTQSEMMLRASCARKWYYRYALKLGKKGFLDFNLIYGSLMHRLLEELYLSKKNYAYPPNEVPVDLTKGMIEEETRDMVLLPQDRLELDLTVRKVQMAFDAYRRHYHKQDARLGIMYVEEIFRLEWEGLQLGAKLDMVAKPKLKDGVFIWDFKTAGQMSASAMDAWTFRFQFLFYCWLFWKFTSIRPMGLMINGLLKTGLRPKIVDRKTKQREDMKEYLARVNRDLIENRERYFFRQRIPLGNDALERFEYEMLAPHVEAFKALRRKDATKNSLGAISALGFSQNTNQCHIYNSYCEYLSLCKDGSMALSEFETNETKHPELQ